MATSKELFRWASAGGVDDGKSTLVGRLLYELGVLPEDQIRTLDGDFAKVTDGLRAEREQGITIDVAYRYFESSRRKYILADTPGHDRYQRNTVSGICDVDLVVLLVDARRGLTQESLRHLALCRSVQVPQVVLAANKMDLVPDPQQAYNQLSRDFDGLVVPVCALTGDNLAKRGALMSWYEGPTLFEVLEQAPLKASPSTALRLSVQGVLPSGEAYGTVSSGRVEVGGSVLLLPASRLARVERLYRGDQEVAVLTAGEPAMVRLNLPCQRGDLVCSPSAPPLRSRHLRVGVSTLASRPLQAGQPYLALCGHRQIVARWHPPEHLELEEAWNFDLYHHNRSTGSLVFVDPQTHETVAAAVVQGVGVPKVLWFTGLSGAGKSTLAGALRDHLQAQGQPCLWLDGDELRSGLCGDLDFTPEGRRENLRRAAEVAKIALAQGFTVLCSFISPFSADRASVREILGAEHFIEVFVCCSLQECQRRDPKGLYLGAARDQVPNFTGVSSPYEAPECPDLTLDTEQMSVSECLLALLRRLGQ